MLLFKVPLPSPVASLRTSVAEAPSPSPRLSQLLLKSESAVSALPVSPTTYWDNASTVSVCHLSIGIISLCPCCYAVAVCNM